MSKKYQTETSAKTTNYYHSTAKSFWKKTKDHDVTENYQAFLSAMPAKENLNILDFGCGPGRDVLYFKNLNHTVTGLDGANNFCKMARELTGCTILEQDFLSLDLPATTFDGIFANATIFHVPSAHLDKVLKDLQKSLKPNGILFSSNPRGDKEGWNGDRFGFHVEYEQYQEFLEEAGFKVLSHYYRPKNMPRDEQPWLAVVSQKVG